MFTLTTFSKELDFECWVHLSFSVRYTKKIGVLSPNFAEIGDESTNMKMPNI
jgi:hypothetical protein